MNKTNHYLKYLYSGFFILICFSIIFHMNYLAQYNCFWNDDIHYCAYKTNEGVFSSLNFASEHGGGYIGLFLCKFLSFGLPNFLGIHPYDFIGKGQSFLLGTFVIITLTTLIRFFTINVKSRILNIFMYSLITFYFFISGYYSWIFNVNYNFYRYFFSIMFFGIFWYHIYRNSIIKTNKINKLKLVIACFCGYTVGCSIEISFFTSCLLIALLAIYNLITKSLTKQFHYKLKGFELTLNKNFYIPAIFLYIATILFTTSQGFQQVASDRGMSNIQFNIEELKEFCILYSKICITDIWFYWILFAIITFSSLFIAYKKSEIKKTIFPILLQLSIMCVMFSLYMCGKTFDSVTRDRFYLEHINIIFLYKMLILFPFLTLLGYTIKNIQLKFNHKITTVIFSLLLLITNIFYGIHAYKEFHLYKPTLNLIKEYKQLAYKTEKILRFYYLKDMKPYLPSSAREAVNQPYAFIPTNQMCDADNIITDSYFPRIYKDKKSEKRFCFSDNAMETFYNLGGTFSEEELENIEFSRLFNENFVLNKDIN